MKVRAITKYLRVSPKKLRMRGDLIKGMRVEEALAFLKYEGSKSGRLIFQTLKSAASNAIANHQIDPETIVVHNVIIGEGPRLKRVRPRARGRTDRIIKPTSHIFITVEGKVIYTTEKKVTKARSQKALTVKKVKKIISRTANKAAPKKVGKPSKGTGQATAIRKEGM